MGRDCPNSRVLHNFIYFFNYLNFLIHHILILVSFVSSNKFSRSIPIIIYRKILTFVPRANTHHWIESRVYILPRPTTESAK